MAFVDTQRALFTRHKNRLAVVREQKEKARLEFAGKHTVNFVAVKFLALLYTFRWNTHTTDLERFCAFFFFFFAYFFTVFLSAADEDGPDCADAELYSEASSVLTGSRLGSKYSHSNSRISSCVFSSNELSSNVILSSACPNEKQKKKFHTLLLSPLWFTSCSCTGLLNTLVFILFSLLVQRRC